MYRISIILFLFLFTSLSTQAQNLKNMLDSIKKKSETFEQQQDSASLNQYLDGIKTMFTDPEAVEESKNLFNSANSQGVVYHLTFQDMDKILPFRVAVSKPMLTNIGLKIFDVESINNNSFFLAGESILNSKVADRYINLTKSQTVREENEALFNQIKQAETEGNLIKDMLIECGGLCGVLGVARRNTDTFSLVYSTKGFIKVGEQQKDHTYDKLFLVKVSNDEEVLFIQEVADYYNPQSYIEVDERGNIIIAQSERGVREWGSVTITDRSKPRGQQVLDSYRGIIKGGRLNIYSFDENGNKLWHLAEPHAHIKAMRPAPGGGVIIGGGYYENPKLFPDFSHVDDEKSYVAHIKDGKVVFATTFGSSKGLNRIHSLTLDEDGNIYAGGKSEKIDEDIDYSKDKDYVVDEGAQLAQLNDSGHLMWVKTYHDDSETERKTLTDLVFYNNKLYAVEYKQLSIKVITFDRKGKVLNEKLTDAQVSAQSLSLSDCRFISLENNKPYLLLYALGGMKVDNKEFPLHKKLAQYVITSVE